MASIEQYKMANGYYDTAKIRVDAGVDDRSAAFLDIFGSFDDDGKDTGGALPGEWQAMLDEATRRNAEMTAAAEQTKETEARNLMTQPQPWGQRTWQALKRLGYASFLVDTETETWHAELNERGQRLMGE